MPADIFTGKKKWPFMERPLQLSGELGGDYLVLDETTDCPEANKSASEQHRGRATIGDRGGWGTKTLTSETGDASRIINGRPDVSSRIKARSVKGQDVRWSSPQNKTIVSHRERNRGESGREVVVIECQIKVSKSVHLPTPKTIEIRGSRAFYNRRNVWSKISRVNGLPVSEGITRGSRERDGRGLTAQSYVDRAIRRLEVVAGKVAIPNTKGRRERGYDCDCFDRLQAECRSYQSYHCYIF